jgi:hypothetical protein
MKLSNTTKTNKLTLEEINEILSETLQRVVSRDISLRQASMVVKIASTLTATIRNIDLEERLEFLENNLKSR